MSQKVLSFCNEKNIFPLYILKRMDSIASTEFSTTTTRTILYEWI